MPAFTAEQASINNGSKVVQINSGESVANIRSGDFLVLAGFIVEINRAFVGAANEQLIELVQAWSHSTQSNQSCIVIPTTAEFKTVVAALNEANMLVNNNYKAMQDWQTKTGTVTFSNKDGTTTTVKTLKQIEADNAAQLEAYHPYPWAMRKVEFEARRAANNEKFAASGFVHFGIGHSSGNVNSGLWTATSLGSNTFALGKSGAASGQVGDSETDYPVVNIAGVITDINSIGYAPSKDLSLVKLPPAEDGTRTYDSATGVSVTHATSAIAFASETDTNKVVTDRVDMWGLEGFLREINDADPFVYNKGEIQSLATSINGIATVSDTVRPITYFAWYEGDTTSRGKGVNWQTATESQRIIIASDPKNNIRFDDKTGKFYQWCIRGRSFAGLGNGDWGFIEGILNTSRLTFSGSTLKAYVNPQGALNTDVSYLDVDKPTDERAQYVGFGATNSILFSDKIDTGLFGIAKYSGSDSSNTKIAVNGECYFLVCGTVSRLNQGAYHPSFNSFGAAKASDDKRWYETVQTVTYKADCFDPSKLLTGSGSIASVKSGRSDDRYYDAIYANGQGGVCRDMRYRASGLTDVDFAEADLSIKDGTYRGTEKPPFSVPFVVGPNSITTYISLGETKPDWWDDKILGTGSVTDLGTSKMYVYNQATGEKLFVWLSGYTTTSNIGWYLRTVKVEFASSTAANDNHGLVGGESLILQTTSDKSLSKFSVSGDYTYADVIGDPANIFMCDDLKNGWIGGWCQDIPDGTSKNFKLTRPAQISQSYPSPYTLDNGDNWIATPRTIDLTTNSILGVAWGVGFVTAINYTVKARVTKRSINSEIYGRKGGLGSVFVSAWSSFTGGKLLADSLISKTLVGTNTFARTMTYNLSQGSLSFDRKLPNSISYPVKHTPVDINTVDSPAFKALNYNVVENQQAFINYAYTELKNNGIDWGDDGKVHIADNQTTMPDENGNTVLVGTARCVEPLGWIKNDK
ncbi:hypothetical protein H3302_08015 [Pseudoalteromonas sp. MT33b]|uniref:hypothetical protein n=1 Tax=Pseudoalteromonas sp. MT33b TaxID=2759705 RepID=UPI0015F7F5FD|nr:hypothetical protein [Pseudoalteromonas sp. MT33b]QMW15990.1 hypothetical protein H3302_08015 [Pseudoalteromonas sp. MT33b]